MNKKFTVIHGHADVASISRDQLHFLGAFVTNTRLMGVVVLSISWEFTDSGTSLHQFFYFDAEEAGLESYHSLTGDDPLQLLTLENTLVGGLGGKKININQSEAEFILRQFISATLALKKPLPSPVEEYRFLMAPYVSDQNTGFFPVMKKMCAPITHDYELVNYFLMRSFAKDQTAVEYLTDGRPISHYLGKSSTLHKNTIHPSPEANSFSLLCESLIEANQSFAVVISEVFLKGGVNDRHVSRASITSTLKISQAEAAMMLARSEFITVYQVMDVDEFLTPFLSYSMGFAKTPYDSGTLFIQFNPDNAHVRNQHFRLNHDVSGLYYLSEFGQLIVGSYEEETIKALEKRLSRRSMQPYLLLEDRFEFKSPILYEFILSGYDDFLEFVEASE